MDISSVIAQNIVFELKKVINQEINFMNRQSIIIASTDEKRINQFHEGAFTVIKTKKPLLIAHDKQYVGSKKGINMPIVFDNSIIGVIGITGEREDVEKNGMIIKKMTEILVKEDYLSEVTFKENERSRYILNRILNKHLYKSSELPADLFQYDYSKEHFCIIGSYQSTKMDDSAWDDIHRLLNRHRLKNEQIISHIIDQKLYMYIESSTIPDIESWLASLASEIESHTKTAFFFGIGPLASSLSAANKSFHYALNTLAWNLNYKKTAYLFFDQMDIGLLITSIDPDRKKMIQKQILSFIPEAEYEELKTVLFVYGEMNKSVQAAADYLFIHKNTFQYKLNKILEYTGYNPRILNEYVCLYLAFLLD